MKIAVFVHQPVCSVDSINGVIQALNPKYSFKLFSRDEVESAFFRDVDMICIPGGIGDADRFDTVMKYNAKHVRRFVDRGGKYLGICMGAYWADQDYLNIAKDLRVVQYIKRPGTDTRRPHTKAQRVLWAGAEHRMYFYDGCTYTGPGVAYSQLYSLYPNGDPMAIVKDNLALIGCHPESERYWYDRSYMQPHWHKGLHHRLLLEFVDKFMSQ